MPPKGYRTLTVRADVIELLGRAKRLFHKTQIQILFEAVSEYIGRHHEHESAVLPSSISDAVAVAWSAGVFEASGSAYPHPSPAMKTAVEIADGDRQLLERLKVMWGGGPFTKEGLRVGAKHARKACGFGVCGLKRPNVSWRRPSHT